MIEKSYLMQNSQILRNLSWSSNDQEMIKWTESLLWNPKIGIFSNILAQTFLLLLNTSGIVSYQNFEMSDPHVT